MQQPLLLNYGTRRATPWRRYLLIAAFLIAAGFVVKKCGPAVWQKYQLLSTQSACMNFNPAAGDKIRGDQLGARFAIAMKNALPAQPSVAGIKGDFIFIGCLWNKNGRRLVLVRRFGAEEVNQDSIYFGPELFRAYVLEPGTLTHAPKMLANEQVEPSYIPEDLDTVANTPWVGFRDTSDASSFFIPFSAVCGDYKYKGIFKGSLDDDEHVHLADTSANSNWKRYVVEVNRLSVLLQ